MPAPIYIGATPNPYGRMAMNYLSQMAMAKAAHKMRMEEMAAQAKLNQSERAKEATFQAALAGSDIFRSDAQQPPAGYVQNPWDPTVYLSRTQKSPYKIGEIKEFKQGDMLTYKQWTPAGWQDTGIVAPRYKPQTTVNVNTGLTKKTQGELESQIVEGSDLLNDLQDIKLMTKPEYLTWGTRAGMKLKEWESKAGVSDKFSTDLADYQAWKKRVDTRMLKWRKWVTGVAGGPAEMQRIEKTTLNTSGSFEEFVSTWNEMDRMTRAAIRRANIFLDQGIDVRKLTQKQRAELFATAPLSNYEQPGPTQRVQVVQPQRGTQNQSGRQQPNRVGGRNFPKPTPQALQYLRQHPETRDYFRRTFGFVPEGY